MRGSQHHSLTAVWSKAKPDSSPPKEIQAIRQFFEEALAEMEIKLVVLIDDLDRCLPPTSISTLEAIRLCGRFARNGYRHCGRCVPCLVRRAAFQAWGEVDGTVYVHDLSRDSDDYVRFDDVRSAAMAVAQVRAEGLDAWMGTSLSAALLGNVAPYRATVERGLQELGTFLDGSGVK